MKEALLKLYDLSLILLIRINWLRSLTLLKVICIIISIFSIAAIITLIYLIRKNIRKSMKMIISSVTASDQPPKVIDKQWQAVLEKVESGNESDYKLAVIEADKIFDDLVKRIGYKGGDMGERLQQITSAQLPNINDIWEAHKIRNKIAHESDYRINRALAKRAVEIYQEAMETLEAL